MLGKMDYEIRKWKPEDAYALSKILNNNKITDNLRDGIPCPYTEVDALNYIRTRIKFLLLLCAVTENWRAV